MRRLNRWWWAVGCVLLLAGCATGEAGRASSPVDARLIIEWPRVQGLADGTFPGAVTVTATQSVVITPTSSAQQTPTNTVDTTATVPASVVPPR